MAKKQPSHEQEPQGMLFQETVIGNGSIDPGSFETKHVFTPNPDGVYPEAKPINGSGNDIAQPPEVSTDQPGEKSAEEVVKTYFRSRGQEGKHSTVDEEGNHTKIYPGKYLPGFGPVTDSNIRYARTHAENLDRNQ